MADAKKAVKKTTVADLEEQQRKLTARLYEAEHIIKSLNIALIGMAYSLKVNPKRINRATSDQFLEFIEKNVHPMIRQADKLTGEVAEKAKKDIAQQTKESQS